MRLALLKTYRAVPEPKVVILVGACAISGGPFIDHEEVHNGTGGPFTCRPLHSRLSPEPSYNPRRPFAADGPDLLSISVNFRLSADVLDK